MPEPSTVLEFAIVGLEVVLLQQTPFDVIVAPPSLVLFPQPVAVVCVIDDIVFVVTPVGIVADKVLTEIASP